MNYKPLGGPPKSGTNAKPMSTRKTLKRLWKYILGYRKTFIFGLLLALISNVLLLFGPYLSGLAIDEIERGRNLIRFEKIFFFVAIMIIFYIVAALLSYLQSFIMISLSQKISYKMRKDVFDKLMKLPISFFDKSSSGDVISKMSYDIDTINTSLSSDIIQMISSLIMVVGSLVMMVIISPLLVLVFVITVPISIIYTRLMTKKTRRMFRLRSRKLGELNGYVEEMFTNTKTIKAYAQEKAFIERFDDFNNEAADATYNADYYGSVIGQSVLFINNFSLVLISVFGSLLYMSNKISLGNISSFVLYSRKFSNPINEMANIINELQSALAASERVLGLIDEEPLKETTTSPIYLEEVAGNVRVEDVSFGYSDVEIIHDLSFTANRSQMIAIVGPTGAGKTTIINLLMRFYDPNKGEIFLDDVRISDMYRKEVRKKYAMVLQDAWLFNGSIYDNLVYGNLNVTKEDVRLACESLSISDFVERMDNKYDTILSNDGANMSKGQKQLLTIARAYLQNSNMLILDEATSNVDTKTEINIQKAMLKLMKGKTCFVIAHRLSTIQNADLILVFKDGKIIEKGKHVELLEKKGFYYTLYNSQFENAGE